MTLQVFRHLTQIPVMVILLLSRMILQNTDLGSSGIVTSTSSGIGTLKHANTLVDVVVRHVVVVVNTRFNLKVNQIIPRAADALRAVLPNLLVKPKVSAGVFMELHGLTLGV